MQINGLGLAKGIMVEGNRIGRVMPLSPIPMIIVAIPHFVASCSWPTHLAVFQPPSALRVLWQIHQREKLSCWKPLHGSGASRSPGSLIGRTK